MKNITWFIKTSQRAGKTFYQIWKWDTTTDEKYHVTTFKTHADCLDFFKDNKIINWSETK